MLATDFEIDMEELLGEISSEQPSGEDLEYDAQFGEMERAAEPKPEQQFGDTIIPGEGPEWKQVLKHTQSLFGRTKDLRVSVFFAQATLAVHGLPAFIQSVALLRAQLEKFWDTIHPQLDPDDDNDPTIRVNTLAMLCDSETTLGLLRATPLVASRSVGKFCYRDVLIAQGELSAPAGTEAADMAVIGAAFQDVEVSEIQTLSGQLDELLENVKQIESFVTDQVGVGNATSLEPLRAMIRDIQSVYRDQLAKRGVATESDTTDEVGDGSGAGERSAGGEARLSGQISSREDVVRALDKLMEYYQRHEPSSPLPLLFTRARRLANADFLTIIQDIAPDGIDQARLIGGRSGSGNDEESGNYV